MHAYCHFSHACLFVTLWIVACQALLSGICQARILEWVALPSSRGSSPLRDLIRVSLFVGDFFTTDLPGKTQVQLRPHFLSLLLCSIFHLVVSRFILDIFTNSHFSSL